MVNEGITFSLTSENNLLWQQEHVKQRGDLNKSTKIVLF